MVHKYPPTLEELKQRSEHVPASEILFYKMLGDFSDDWYAWHSVDWAKDLRKEHGEADFLIFNENYGFLIIEVKGGLISYEEGTYYTMNRLTSEKHALKRSPLKQAQNSMYFLKDFYVKTAKGETKKGTLLKTAKGRFEFPLSFSSSVFFPDCRFKSTSNGFQIPHGKIFDRSDVQKQVKWKKLGQMGPSPLELFFISLLDVYREKRAIKPKAKEFFLNLITPKLNAYINVKHYYEIRKKKLEQINHVQEYLLDALSQKNRCMFQGSAGSGKTYLAMKKAMRLYKQDVKTLFLSYNRELRDSIESYLCEQLNITTHQLASRVTVITFHSLLKELAKVFFKGSHLHQFYNLLKNFKFEKITSMLKEKIHLLPIERKFEAILIDEAQDINPNVSALFFHLLKDLNKSLFYVFFDKAQNLFTDNFIETQFGMVRNRDLIILEKNLRNTIEIAKWMKNATKLGNYTSYSDINGLKISTKQFPSSKKALQYSIAYIEKKYFSHGITPQQVLILSNEKLVSILPHAYKQNFSYYYAYVLKNHDEQKRFFVIQPNKFNELPLLKERLQINGDHFALFKTIQGFKGLESDIVFLLLNKKTSVNLKRDKYVGGSRAKFKLHLYTY